MPGSTVPRAAATDAGPAETRRLSRSARAALAACLLVSGAAALVYEVLWLRQLGLVMGHTAYALSTVLTAFLGGLALGAYAGGRWARRGLASPMLYAGIEVAIAAAALAMPWLISGLDPLFGVAYRGLFNRFLAYNLVQFAACGAVLVLPTFLMGTTLPIVAALVVDEENDVGAGTGLLYAINSLGGVIGAGLAGFALLPAMGMLATSRVAAALNVGAAALAFAVARRGAVAEPAPARSAPAGSSAADADAGVWAAPAPVLVALLYAVSGFAALALEVGWARLVGLSIGSTTYAFTMTLVTYIAGLALGSLVVPRIPPLARNPVRTLFGLHAVVAIWTLLSVSYLGDLPVRVLELLGTKGLTFNRLLAGELVLVLLSIAVPTLALGGMFPLVTGLLDRSVSSPGYATGLTYAANTLGNIAGSWVAGFVLIPAIGMRGTIVFAALLSGSVGVAYLAPAAHLRPFWALLRAAPLVAVMAVAAWRAPDWRREIMTSAPYLLVREVSQYGSDLVNSKIGSGGVLIEYREGATGLVAVHQEPGQMMLYQDGLDESGNMSHAIRFFGHIPMMFHGHAKDVLVIGLGAGQTLRAVLSHPVERADVVELSPDVVDVADKYFANDLLSDPRTHLAIADARNHLRYSRDRWDVIVSQPSYPWSAGSSNLFTREYFQDMRDHLKPGGVACSWFFTHDEPTAKSIVRAWAEVFPNSYLVRAMGGPKVLIGMNDDRPLDPSAIAAALADPDAARDLQAFGMRDPSNLIALIAARGPELARLGADVPASDDDNAYVAFNALRGLYDPPKKP
ncbi:MAG TPA: fused MFS/spermidine synthase [Candidatus Binatia bacterium]|nr:fused MFS/spermidine synthase [Candidatus Binatia bacterium]